MRLVLLLLMAIYLMGCVPQFPFSCEDAQASICYLQRRPIFAPRDKPTSARTPAPREGEHRPMRRRAPQPLAPPARREGFDTANLQEAKTLLEE